MLKSFLLVIVISCSVFAQYTPKRDSTRILFFGDSHTEGSGNSGYRFHLLHYLDSLGYKFKTVGNRLTNNTDPPGYGFTIPQAQEFHQGINGISANTYKSLVRDTLTRNLHGQYSNRPHIAIVMLGSNDIANGSYSTTTIANNIGAVMDSIWAVEPITRIIVSNVLHWYPYSSGTGTAKNDSVNLVNTKLQTIVATRVANGKYCKLVDMNTPMAVGGTAYLQSDSIHATELANHNIVSATYLPYVRQAIDTVLPVGSIYTTYYNNWCMGTDAQWSTSAAYYMPTKTYGSYLGKATHIILFNTRDNMVDSGYAPYFSVTKAYSDAGGGVRDSLDYFYNGVANPSSGYASWVARGTAFDLIDSAHAHGRKVLLEMQGVTATNGANNIIGDSTKTEVFTTAVADFIYRHNFDGADLNVESGITFTAANVARFFRILRDKLPNKVLTCAPVVTQTSLYAQCISYIDYMMPQHYAYALNDQPPGGNAVFLNSPMYLDNIPVNSNHQSLVDVNPYYSYTQPWSVIDWYSKGWSKGQLVMLLSTEANPFRGVDTMFSWKSGGKPFWADTIAHLMKSRGGTYHYDAVHIGGYISGTSTQTTTYRGTSIEADSTFYIPILATEALDTITSYFISNGYRNFGLFDISTDARTPATVKTPLHDHLGSLLTIGTDSIMSVTSGNNQIGYINSVLSLPCVVTIRDDYGYGVPDIPVTFSVYSAPSGATGYSLSDVSVVTNSSGQASTTLTFGNKTGSYVVRAEANTTESPLSFTATAVRVPDPSIRVPFRRR